MKRTGVLALIVLALAIGVIAWRETHRVQATSPPAASLGGARVVLFVDLSEEDEAEGCGALIHAVREAKKRGVVTEEVDTREPGDRATRYRLLTAPAVILLDGKGRETRRFEGESPDTVAAVRAELTRLSSPR